MMEAGETELRKAFEEVTTRNVRAVLDHANTSRDLVRHLENKVVLLEGLLRQYDDKLEALQKQITSLQMKVYAGGT